ncbi:prolipoprotein diacylglyceryl transferase [Corynebacterium falsenii DSM 44353]|uniref:prolipoprotein diacylglyceryl transferase n=1 Tax=Corynebacterium falsenii TaxID=108486 RepID=UPI0003E93088|nr:prolipoprotein diacylglyceryl transferase [Corynebacterium falsenii]AHI02980.1 prolipoprotein diacylglyceryl transferase [Corynebacterium falsenii DSM 44353]UBI03694.1 prolipoprotein diacylglyceryl transferase [Corynebacterium falsenii]UBI06299.1 prolipoprotein diacylglyceryl transferase [Corynebacterium falsenii]
MHTDILATIPSPPQGVWMLGPIPIRAYALCILTGVIVAYFWTRRRYAAKGGNPEVTIDALLVAIPFGIIGARLYHVITDHDKYFGPGRNPMDVFKITNGGLGIWGGVIAGSLAVWILFRVKKLDLATFADAAAPTIILAQAIGRLGNWFNQELYGGPSDAPWALEIYRRVNDAGYVDPIYGHSTGEVIATVQPTFLYELVWNLAVVVALLVLEKRFRIHGGRLFILYVALYTFGRFFIENLRTDPATTVFGDIRINVVVSAVVFVAAMALFIWTGWRQRKREGSGGEQSASRLSSTE